jgi:hypothetical protein
LLLLLVFCCESCDNCKCAPTQEAVTVCSFHVPP